MPPSAVVGSRNALQSGEGQRAIPVRASLAGSIAAVAAVLGAVVFGASLNGLVGHPSRFGWNWNLLLQAEGGYGHWIPGRLAKLIDGQPDVAGWSEFGFGQVPMGPGGAVVPVLAVQPQTGFVEPPTTAGHALDGPDQIELGAVTMRELGLHIGEQVVAGAPPYQRRLTLVGTVTLPSFGAALADHVSLGRGAMLSETELLAILGLNGREARAGPNASEAAPSAAAIDFASGTTAAQRAAFVRRVTSANPDGTPGGTYPLTNYLAAAVVNASQMGGQPLALALGVGAASVLSLATSVLAVVLRRRRELALLKALGMTRRQVRSIVGWQTTIALAVALIVGIPIGITLGRLAWTVFATSLGVVPIAAVPVLEIAAGVVAVLAICNALAAVPAAIAARTVPYVGLRPE